MGERRSRQQEGTSTLEGVQIPGYAHECARTSKASGVYGTQVEVKERVGRGCEVLGWPGADEANYLACAEEATRMQFVDWS